MTARLVHPRLLRSPRVMIGLAILSAGGLTMLAAAGPAAAAQPAVGLGTATSFAVLAGSTVTNTGPTSISGNVGVSPLTAVTGLTPAMVHDGTIHSADAVAGSAQSALTTAFNDAAGRGPAARVTADLGGQTLTAGVYAGTTLGLTGSLTLDAKGKPDAVFVFQSAKTLIAANSSSVILKNGANACNVFWEVGSSATLGTSATFAGSVLAQATITVATASTVQGRLLARTGAVTLEDNTITRPSCAPSTGSSTSAAPTTGSSTSPTSGGTSGAGSTSPTKAPTVGASTAASSAPTVGTVSPSTGPVAGGTLVTVTGTGFVPGATTVTVGGVTVPSGNVHVLSPTKLTFIAPAHASGGARVVISTKSGTSTQQRTLTYGSPVATATTASTTTANTSTATSTSATVTTTRTLASTGSPDTTLLAGAALLLLGGLTVLFAGRRRTTPRHRR